MEQSSQQQALEVAGTKERDKPLVKDLNEHILCPLCRGYLIDAMTLVECLHSFCRGCIVRRFSGGPKACPVCNTDALSPLVPDADLQRLVYLVVPGLFRSEQERRRHFRQLNPQCSNLSSPLGAPDLSFDDPISLSLCEVEPTNDGTTRYLKCPAGVTVKHLLRLLMLKRGWDDTEGDGQQCGNNKIEMMYEVIGTDLKSEFEVLNPSWTLMDLACIFEWKREAPMKLFYRITRIEEPIENKSLTDSTSLDSSSNNTDNSSIAIINTDTSNQSIENIQRPPTPPPSPKPAISRTDSLDKNLQVPPTTSVVDQFSIPKEHESKKPRCEVTPVLRAPDPPPIDAHSKPGKVPKLEHQHKRKKRRNKRVIAEITTTPREDLLKLKVRLTPCPPRVTSSAGSGSQTKDKLIQMRAVRKEKTKSSNSQKHRQLKEHKSTSSLEDTKNVVEKVESMETNQPVSMPEIVKTAEVVKEPSPVVVVEKEKPEKESPKNEEVLRRLGLVAISEAIKTREEKTKIPAQSSADKNDPAVEREKLEKQLRESKANRVRSLLAEKQMRDTLKSIMSNSKETTLTNVAAPSSSSSTSTSRSGTPTTNSLKRKEPPPLTPLRNAKRSNVTFAPSSFTIGKYESPLDLSSPSSIKDNVLDLSSGITEITAVKYNPKLDKPVGILRNSSSRPPAEKLKEEARKTHDSNLRTLSDAAVSLLSDRGVTAYVEKSTKWPQNFLAAPTSETSNVGGKVALRIPQPHQRITGFGMKIKPNIGVRHIPNPQAVVASQYRNQRTGYFNLANQPP